MARLAFKPDSSFFRKIVVGAVGARAICAHLRTFGHDLVELERGSTDTKLWKDVKRKRVRIPDLVCLNCGLRVESRAKTKSELSMSHSFTDASRAWDYGLVDDDWIAFPVCAETKEEYASRGKLRGSSSYWNERNWINWRTVGRINYFPTKSFRKTGHAHQATKGVTERSETMVEWNATFSTRDGLVERIVGQKVTVRRHSDGHRYTWNVSRSQTICVSAGETVETNQVIAAAVSSVRAQDVACATKLTAKRVKMLLKSRERTQRFTGVKLARIHNNNEFEKLVEEMLKDAEEDLYVRLEAASYLVSIGTHSCEAAFGPFYGDSDEQTQLEAIIATGEAGTPDAVTTLSKVLDNPSAPYFIRSAAAWSLSRIGSKDALDRLVKAFADINANIREEALDGLVAAGQPALRALLAGLQDGDVKISAGSAESLRQLGDRKRPVIPVLPLLSSV